MPAPLPRFFGLCWLVWLALWGLLQASCVHAQTQAPVPELPVRSFPESVLQGRMVMGVAPALRINGQPFRLSPGVRIWSTDNLLIPSASLYGQPLVVNYRQEAPGLVREIWLLRPAELQLQPPGSSAPANWSSEVSDTQEPALGSPYKSNRSSPL